MAEAETVKVSRIERALAVVERVGNKLPDPAVLFIALLVVVWVLSWLLSYIEYSVIDPRTDQPLVVINQLSGPAMTAFFSSLITNFSQLPPVGVVLVAMLGIGVAESTGFISAALRMMLSVTARWLLTPMIIVVGIISHTAVDAGYVVVIPLGGVIFYAAGRHPLAGIAAAFAGVSGGFSANFIPSALDPMLATISQIGANIIDSEVKLNELNNIFFTMSSSILIVSLGWFLTEKVVEPRLNATAVDEDAEDLPKMDPVEPHERRGVRWALIAILIGILLLIVTAIPSGSAWRGPDGSLIEDAPLLDSIVALIFFLFLIPGVVYGIAAGTVKSSRDIIQGQTHAMTTMAYYLVIMFWIAQFIYAFGTSNLGVLLALKGAALLKALAMPASLTITGIVILTGVINLFVGSSSTKWALLAPIFIPMLMTLGISPDLAQAAYRVGDSSTNIITPLMPYFPLVVVFCQRYVKSSGIGTVTAMMLPYSITFLIAWTIWLLIYWWIGFPLGFQASYTYG